ncbi:LCP family protein [Geodermatophilus poikilotrophus]|uniref:Cell envelope-related function transcriptional attenuator common domain-containing protein n=1 Tax=Geodermatophilus poikilotrophus TaxID=1333667 RepID=A0A1I0HHC7_9ACTN|nr:LCP family protein [Geodermatophilus poikilotrophus]SET83299.1 cell envelope-related function transcriptional attenuator common domain-containing protein [Geodermatophilus poikilotrophus]
MGRRRAARTGEIPLPLATGEKTPERRRGLPPVPAEDTPAVRDAVRAPSGRRAGDVPRAAADTPAPQRGLPPVPGGPAGRAPASPGPPAAVPPLPPIVPQQVDPAAPQAQPGGLPPVPPSARPSVPLFPPLEDGTGHRPSRPVAPLPPIPGRDARPSGATRLTPPSPRERRAARRAARSPGRRRLVRVATGLAALVGVVLAYHLGLYFYVDQRIERVQALTPDGAEVLAPGLQEGAATYLVVGTGLPGEEGPASVATLLAHVTADEERAVLVSIPPTALVDTPTCIRADGEVREAVTESFAASLLEGGPSCTVRAVQQLSGLRVDHYLGVDLGRLPGMVDALGGVAVCLPTATPAVAASAQPLPAGASELSGERATGYLAPGDAGADVAGEAVAERAQLLLTSTLRTAMSAGTLGNPATLTGFLTRASDALTVDEATTLGDLRTLGGTLGDLPGDAVQRIGLPVAQVGYVPAGSAQAHVVLDDAATRSLFDTVIEEGRLPAELVAPEVADVAAAPAPAAAEQPVTTPAAQPLTAAPAGITVDVLNGTATGGLAATVAEQMRAQGFGVGQVGNELGVVNETVVRYGAGAEEQARTVAAAVPGAVLQPSDATGGGIQLVLGPGFSSVVPVVVTPPAPVAAPETPAPEAPATPSAEPVAAASC